MLTNFYNVSKYIKDNNQKVAALFREVRLLFMIIFVCPLYKSSYEYKRSYRNNEKDDEEGE